MRWKHKRFFQAILFSIVLAIPFIVVVHLQIPPFRSYLQSFNSSRSIAAANVSTALLNLIQCADNNNKSNQLDASSTTDFKSNDNFVIAVNYVRASRKFECHETITYTTTADFTFLCNIVVLVERWRGPISVAIYTPGDDYHRAVASIAYLRKCTALTHLVRQLVTFHVFFDKHHMPTTVSVMVLFFY